jgi:hypothetical protein
MLRLTMPTLLMLALALATAIAAMNTTGGAAMSGYSLIRTTHVA